MAIGDTVVSDGIEFEVVWDGGEGLIGRRESRPTGIWTPPRRIYNKKDKEFWKDRGEGLKEEPTIEGGIE